LNLIKDGQFSHDPEAVSMSSADAEDLVARLSGGLSPADRAAFHKAAENALSHHRGRRLRLVG
jgi:hypothetical protein